MAEPTLYLFDGHNLFHAGNFADLRELRDDLASFVALKGAKGVLVFDGAGADESFGPLEVRYAKNADAVLERLAAEHRDTEVVCLVSSDFAVRGTSGQEVQKRSSATFLGDLEDVVHNEERRERLGDRLEPGTRATLEQMRRGADAPSDFTTVERRCRGHLRRRGGPAGRGRTARLAEARVGRRRPREAQGLRGVLPESE